MKNQDYIRNSINNYNSIKKRISDLKELLNPFLTSFKPKDFWDYVKVVNNDFKTLKPLTKEHRENLWSEFQSLCETAKQKQKSEQENYKYKSSKNKDEIIYFIKSARLNSKVNYSKSQELMGKALGLMKEKKLTKEDRNECWKFWKKIKDNLSFEKKTERQNNYNYIRSKIVKLSNTVVYGDPKKALEEIKEVQRELKNYPMDEFYWNEVKDSLAKYWNKAQLRLDEYYREKKRDWEAKQKEYTERKANWIYKQELALEKFKSIIRKNEEYIENLREQIDKLEDQMYGSSSSSFKSRASGWISEKLSKISDIQSSNSDLEYKIRDIRNQLNK